MLDTTQHMQQKQLEVILSKSESERAKMGINMMEFAYQTVRSSILKKNPNLIGKELIIEIFKRFYANDFSPQQLFEIEKALLKG